MSNPVYAKASSVPTVVATSDGLSMHSGNSADYAAPLLNSGYSQVNSSSHYDQYDNRTGLANAKRRKQIVTATCCCCCILFLLLFFLIPRTPELSLQAATITAGPYQLTQQWQVTNRNPYGITLSNVNTYVYSVVTGGVYKGQSIYGTGQLPGGSAYIPSTSELTVSLIYNFTASAPGVLAAFPVQCCLSSVPTFFFTSGTFDFETTVALHDYRNIGISSTTAVVCCT